MTVLIPALRHIFPMPFGFSVLAAGIVLAVMIFPTITTMAADAMAAVPKSWREASYGLGATRWETIAHVVLPAAKSGIFTGIILGLARALGEALAVAMVIGQMKVFPTSLFLPASTLTTAISADMGGRHGRRRIQCRSVDDGVGLVPAVVPVHFHYPPDQCRFRIKRRTELI